MPTEILPVASVSTKANVYFDGKCVSHDLLTAGGQRKSVGVIFPAQLTFATAAPETMECVGGACEYQLQESGPWLRCEPGQSFQIAGNARFNIRVPEIFHYICHYG
ncbi:pyrimidine/purine nucleoside phosphorylase [Lampropedia cohaerens]|uniref:pyrimidine/purine nucleoside phosphorylase n=1 Tax=Lampropedia cohaerens TaxID=1610491 RepID=UPI000628FBAB|nr:pyrimidine/purine nucleoside phosphorylase [Lampropedia cohaerens]